MFKKLGSALIVIARFSIGGICPGMTGLSSDIEPGNLLIVRNGWTFKYFEEGVFAMGDTCVRDGYQLEPGYLSFKPDDSLVCTVLQPRQ